MRLPILLVAVLLLCSTGCASKGYVDRQLDPISCKLDIMEKKAAALEERASTLEGRVITLETQASEAQLANKAMLDTATAKATDSAQRAEAAAASAAQSADRAEKLFELGQRK